MPNALVIIPTYNEIETIETIVRAVIALPLRFDILVVDDNSPDGTALKVKELELQFPNQIFLENRIAKSGLGTAYIHGFKWALNHDYEFIFEMDADFSHNPADLVRLYEKCSKSNIDLVVGSRYITGVNVVNWSLSRVLMSYFASVYARLIMGFKIHDATSGFICYRKRVLEHLNLDKVQFVGYAFQIEMKYRAYVMGCTIVEIPIVFTDRTHGQSKMSNAIISEAIFGVLLLRIKKVFKLL